MFSWAESKLTAVLDNLAPPPDTPELQFLSVCSHRNSNAALILLQTSISPAAMIDERRGWRPIHVACRFGLMDVVLHLLTVNPNDVHSFDRSGNTPLHHASLQSIQNPPLFKQLVQSLIETYGASALVKNGEGQTPYDLAASGGVRQYLLPLQLQEETKQMLASGGAGLMPGIDLGGCRIEYKGQGGPPPGAAPPGQFAPPSALGGGAPPGQFAPPAPGGAPPPIAPGAAPVAGPHSYSRVSARKADGFHSSSSDPTLQAKYGNVSRDYSHVPPPPTSAATGGHPTPTTSYYGQSGGSTSRKAGVGRYPVYNAVTGQTTLVNQAASTAPVMPPPAGAPSFFNPAANTNAQAHATAATPHDPTAPAISTVANSVSETPPLPNGWTQHTDPSSGKVYYYNDETRVTSWELPEATYEPEVSSAAPVTLEASVKTADESSAATDPSLSDTVSQPSPNQTPQPFAPPPIMTQPFASPPMIHEQHFAPPPLSSPTHAQGSPHAPAPYQPTATTPYSQPAAAPSYSPTAQPFSPPPLMNQPFSPQQQQQTFSPPQQQQTFSPPQQQQHQTFSPPQQQQQQTFSPPQQPHQHADPQEEEEGQFQ
mmetsp:Transcript_17114/g.20922  ORF Transcript_17114/g.20922 Transcript_17114/m.20922 type:complete len:596 (-) Transcript_17114:532-2319(-)